jgi:hypothetical protein
LQKVYHVSGMEVFWKQHQYTILACSWPWWQFWRWWRKGLTISDKKKQSLLESMDSKKGMAKQSSRRDDYTTVVPHAWKNAREGDTQVCVHA